MRILQVLAVLSPDNVYGGPATVALDQCRALHEAGHEVILAAGAMGFAGALPTQMSGAPVKLFPVRRVIPRVGFAGIVTPGMMPWLLRNAGSADAVHVHLARDLITLPAAAGLQALDRPVFVQTHGMVDTSDSPLAAALDTALTRRVLRNSQRTFVLTEAEGRDVRAVAGDAVPVSVLPNGISVEGAPTSAGHGDSPLVLFLARLAPRKRPMAFVQAAMQLAPEFPRARFRLVGPDEGTGDEVSRAIASAGLGDRLEWTGALDRDECARQMGEADIYVLPSVNEPFGMTVLEAMRAGLPPVVTTTCELGPMLVDSGSGLVSEPDPGALAVAIRTLLAEPDLRSEMGRRARQTVVERFSMDFVRDRLLAEYAGTSR